MCSSGGGSDWRGEFSAELRRLRAHKLVLGARPRGIELPSHTSNCVLGIAYAEWR